MQLSGSVRRVRRLESHLTVCLAASQVKAVGVRRELGETVPKVNDLQDCLLACV